MPTRSVNAIYARARRGEAGRRASRRSGKNAYFLTFSVSFSDIVTQLGTRGITGITEDFLFSYVIFTATQADSLNQDLNGLDKNYDPSATWSSLGLVSNGMSPTGVAVVPEVCHSFRLWRC